MIDTMSLHAKAWQQALQRQGRRVSGDEIYRREGEPGLVTARALLARGGRYSSRRAITSLLDDKERRFSRLARRMQVNARLARCLTGLSKQGIPLALVTGTSSHEVRRIIPVRVLRLFAVVVTGDQVRRGKPYPEPYQTAFRRLGVPARRAIVVENAPYGIRAARRAGAGHIIALTSSLPPRFLRGAHTIVTSIPRLCRILPRLAATD